MLTVAVLGPVEVHRDGLRLVVPSGRTTEVLVRLALDAGHPVRSDRLIEDLWGDAASRTDRNTLQSKVSQLRRALGDPALLVSGNGGYTLAIDEADVDALRVVDLAASAAAARRDRDAATALQRAADGLALFRGEALVDAGDGAWLHAHRVRLAEVRLGLLEDHLAARVDLGGGGDVIGELEGLVDQHPLREGLWSSLITALYRAGRQADALAAYTRVRETLLDELGIDPGPSLRALESQILQQSPDLDAAPVVPAAIDASGDAPMATSVGNLPGLSSPLVGRVGELEAVGHLVADERLVTLVGPAGVGKTRLAIEVARGIEAPGGVWLVRLDGTDASSSIVHVVAETLHVPGGEPVLVDRLAGAPTALVLDNCEHVVDAAAHLIGRLLDAAPQLRVLATSQLPLGLDGEAVVTVEPLPIADSIELFTGRASAMRRPFVLDDDTAATVEEVCRSLDGLPLAIELAAARVKSLSVGEIARRLDDRFALLQDPTSRRPERRRALAAAIGWSYELLFPDDQRGLWALASFAGGAPLAAAEHVLGALGVPEASVVDVVGRLVDRSLVSVEIVDGDTVRYRLLDSIRAFALDRLREAGLADTAGAAHAAWFADLADRCAATVRGDGQPACVAVVRAERANVDAALAWTAAHDPRLGVRIVDGFGWTWVVLGDGVAGAARVRGALEVAADVTNPIERLTGLLVAGWLEASAGHVDRAAGDLDAALALADQLDDDDLRADVGRHQAFLALQQGRFPAALDLTAASLAVDRANGRDWEVAASLVLAAFASMVLGDTGAARDAADEAVRLLAPLGDGWGQVHAAAMLGAIAQAEGRFDEAIRSLERAADASEELGFLGQAALHLTTLGWVQHRAGLDDPAIATLHRAIGAAAVSGDLRIAATARVSLARVHRATGADDDAKELLADADRWYRTAGGGDGALLVRCLLAALTAAGSSDRAGREPAGDELEEVLDAARAAPDHEVEVLALDALARIAAADGDPDRGRGLLDAADEARGGAPALGDVDRIDAAVARTSLAAAEQR